ncbi:hypothetical protein HYX19_02030 [Candidatus Woesearchaeota archaeon]|nr:hypothetical protein [Candidatus Woesearchaeota archaeon]
MKRYNKISIFVILVLIGVPLISATAICEFDFLINKNDTIELTKVNSFIGNVKEEGLVKSDYRLLFRDVNQNIIDKINLPITFYIFDKPNASINITPLSISIPCNSKWNRVEILHNDKKIFSLLTGDLICNKDNKCNNYETYLTCPIDCPSGSKDDLCDMELDSICDPDCLAERDPDCKSPIGEFSKKIVIGKIDFKKEMVLKKQKIDSNLRYVTLLILILLIFGFIVYALKIRRKPKLY